MVIRVAADNSPILVDSTPNLSYDATTNRITTSGYQYDAAGNQTRAKAADGVTWLRCKNQDLTYQTMTDEL